MNRKILIGIVAVILLMGLSYFYSQAEFSLVGGCSEKVIAKTSSPSNQFVANEYLVDCGATSDYATQIKLKDVTSGAEALVLSVKGDQMEHCSLSWMDEKQLRIICDAAVGFVYNSKTEARGVKILFEPASLGQPLQRNEAVSSVAAIRA
jgi:hypothetical protein